MIITILDPKGIENGGSYEKTNKNRKTGELPNNRPNTNTTMQK